MLSLYESVTILNSIVGFIGVWVNLTIVYFVIRYKRLRQLTVGGLILLCAINDVIYNAQMTVFVLEAVRSIRNTTTTFQMCFVEKILNVYIAPATKASLLALTLDRVYAAWAPLKYRKRNHARYARFCAAIVTFIAVTLLLYGVTVTPWSTNEMNTSCSAATIFPATAGQIIVGISFILDLFVYLSNGLLVYKISAGNSITPVGGTMSSVAKAAARRQAEITRSVRGTVLIHLIFNTIPFACTGLAIIALSAGQINEETMNTIGLLATLFNILESIFNAYIYVNRLPYFKKIVLNRMGFKNGETVTATSKF